MAAIENERKWDKWGRGREGGNEMEAARHDIRQKTSRFQIAVTCGNTM